MSIQKKIDDKENAVSPVVGVMLMLVVTIIIAAVVAVFATGVVTTTQTAPTAVLSAGDFKVTHEEWGSLIEMKLVHKNGDTLAIDNLELQTFAFGSTKKYDATKMTSAHGSNAISAGDSIVIDVSESFYSTGTPVEWTLVDTASGMGICSGKFVVPAGTISTPSGDPGVVFEPSLTANRYSIKNGDSVSFTFKVPKSYAGITAKLAVTSEDYTLTLGEGGSTEVVIGDEGVISFEGIKVNGSVGACTLTATATKEESSTKVSASCTVNVTSLTVTTEGTITSGSEVEVEFKVPKSYAGGKAKLTTSSVGYTLGNGTTTTEVDIDSEGVAAFKITVTRGDTADEDGDCTLTATVVGSNPEVSASCPVNVNAGGGGGVA